MRRSNSNKMRRKVAGARGMRPSNLVEIWAPLQGIQNRQRRS